jgi:transposase-like protein
MRPNRIGARYQCKDCGAHFDDLTDMIFARHHQPLWVWILCLDLMRLNLWNYQIAQELDLDEDNVHDITAQLGQDIADCLARSPSVWRRR